MATRPNILAELKNSLDERCGLDVSQLQDSQLEARLSPLFREWDCRNMAAFAHLLKTRNSSILKDQVHSAISTETSGFFREPKTFEAFTSYVLPELCGLIVERKTRAYQRKGAKISILCAGGGTGQEAYSISMSIREFLSRHPEYAVEPVDFSILSADISIKCLSKSIAGIYTDEEIGVGLPADLKAKYAHEIEELWHMDEKIKMLMDFRKMNLMSEFVHLGGFDAVFCRGAMTFFNPQSRRHALGQMHQVLSERGFLVLGEGELPNGEYFSLESEVAAPIFRRLNVESPTQDTPDHPANPIG